jgi:hypothetical protein
MKRTLILIAFAVALMLPTEKAQAQSSEIYDNGTVWNMTTIRIDANRGDDYLKRLRKTWGVSMEMAQEAGLIESYMVLSGNAVNDDDYNLMLMIEFKNWAAFDSDPERDAKWDAVQAKIVESMGQEKFDETVDNYDDMREMLGSKVMQQIMFKK